MSRTPALVFALLAALASLAAPAPAQTTILVPKDHATIQGAVDAATSGDTILVSKGTYPESVTVTGLHDLLIRAKGTVILAPPAGPGLLLDTCADCRVEKLRVQGGDVGIRLVSTHDTVLSKCRVEGTTSDGIRSEAGNDNRFEKCIVEGAGGRGIMDISLGGNFPHDDTVLKCTVTGAAADGIAVTGHDHLIDHCTIKHPGGNGITCDDVTHCDHDTITHCKVDGAGVHAISISGTNLVVASCKTTNAVGIGIFDVGGFLDEITKCTVAHVGSAGIACGNQTVQVSIHDCKVSASGDDGIALNGMSHVVQKNKVSKAGDDGIDIFADVCTVTGNKVSASVGDGFVLSHGLNNTLSGNKASGSGGFDLDNVVNDPSNVVDGTNKFKTVGP
jgi:parallel beta-helix repeat protein